MRLVGGDCWLLGGGGHYRRGFAVVEGGLSLLHGEVLGEDVPELLVLLLQQGLEAVLVEFLRVVVVGDPLQDFAEVHWDLLRRFGAFEARAVDGRNDRIQLHLLVVPAEGVLSRRDLLLLGRTVAVGLVFFLFLHLDIQSKTGGKDANLLFVLLLHILSACYLLIKGIHLYGREVVQTA